MLNELLIVERGARQAGLEMTPRHPDVKDARSMPTLLVRLDDQGHVDSIRPVDSDLALWTLRDGQHNSFPFVQPKPALLDIPPDEGFDLQLISLSSDVREIPAKGKNLVVAASVNDVLHFRVFEGDGKVVAQADESTLKGKTQQLRDLRKQLEGLWPPHELTMCDKAQAIPAITAIVGYSRRGTAYNRKSPYRRVSLLAL